MALRFNLHGYDAQTKERLPGFDRRATRLPTRAPQGVVYVARKMSWDEHVIVIDDRGRELRSDWTNH